jgi:hypothetical protein
VPPPTANEIKAQIKSLLTTPLATGKKAKIIDYLALAFKPNEGEDPTVLRSTADPVALASGSTVNRVNCLMISEDGFAQAPAQHDPTRAITSPQGRNLITRRFRLTYFYQFGAASENVFSTNVEVIRTTVNSNPKLGFETVTEGIAGQGAFVHSHDGLQVGIMAPDAFGDTIVHVAEGVLTVRVIEPLGTL